MKAIACSSNYVSVQRHSLEDHALTVCNIHMLLWDMNNPRVASRAETPVQLQNPSRVSMQGNFAIPAHCNPLARGKHFAITPGRICDSPLGHTDSSENIDLWV